MEPVVVSVRDISKKYSKRDAASLTSLQALHGFVRRLSRRLRGTDSSGSARSDDEFWALRGVSFDVRRGERVGIIGRNGAGKSTLLKILSRLVYPTGGEARIRGRVTSLLEVGTGFNMNLNGRENIFLNASLHGLEKSEIDEIFDSIVEFSGVGDFLDLPVKRYSSGMYMRLAFAVAAHLDTDILMLDEVLAVGDMAFQRKCLERVDQMTSNGRALLFVSHSMDAVSRYCDRCIWLEGGTVRIDGDVQEVISSYVEAVLNVRPSIHPHSSSAVTNGSGNGKAARSIKSSAPLTNEHTEIGSSSNTKTSSVSKAPIGENHEKTQEENLETLPEGAELESARVIDSSGQSKTVFRVDEPVGIEMVYKTNFAGLYVPGIHVYCPQDTLAFVAVPPQPDPSVFKYETPVRILSTAWLPVHLLNIGTYSVSLVVFDPSEAPFKRFFVHEKVLSFHCVEASLGSPSARGIVPRNFPGAIRPLLQWAVREASEDVKPGGIQICLPIHGVRRSPRL